MFTKGNRHRAVTNSKQLGKELVAGAFVSVLAVASPVGAQTGGHNGQGREFRGQGGAFVPISNPNGIPVIEDEQSRQRRAKAANGDRKLTPEEKWQLRQLLRTSQ